MGIAIVKSTLNHIDLLNPSTLMAAQDGLLVVDLLNSEFEGNEGKT
jgi:hypothetical protein